MRNKSMAIVASILLSAGIAFAFVGSKNQACCSATAANNQAAEACCGAPCPLEACPIPCCKN